MLQPLDGPAKHFQVTVDNTTPVELKEGASTLPERQVITLQPIDGKIWVYFADEGEVVTAANIIARGFLQFPKGKESYEASATQGVYILSFAGSVDVRVAERA